MNIFDPQAFYKTERFKLFWCDCSNVPVINMANAFENIGVENFNIGKELSLYLLKKKSDKFLDIDVLEYLKKSVVDKASKSSGVTVPSVTIMNLGILFEPGLELDITSFLKDLSKEAAIILLWDGLVEDDALFYWNDKQSELNFSFSDIKVKQISIKNEV